MQCRFLLARNCKPFNFEFRMETLNADALITNHNKNCTFLLSLFFLNDDILEMVQAVNILAASLILFPETSNFSKLGIN